MNFQSQQNATPHRKKAIPDWTFYLLFAGFVLLVVGLSYFTFNGVKNFVADAPTGVTGDPIFAADAASDAGVDAALPDGFSEDTPNSITGQITVLVMGVDERESERGPWRTDTMILLTINPTNNTAGMLSIPRDTWVEIPDYDGVYDRINTAYFRGDADNYPGGGGSALAMRTVRYNFGIPVDYYITVNFNAFIEVVDYLGCVPINVSQSIDDPTFPETDGTGYDPFHIEAGEHCMDSDTLLKYARTRATYGGDFDRAARQQEVIRAVRDHVLSTGQLGSLIAQSPEIYTSVQDDVSTNLSLTQLVDLARLAAKIPDGSICSAVIDNKYVDFVTLSDGVEVSVPDKSKVRILVNDIYNGTGQCALSSD